MFVKFQKAFDVPFYKSLYNCVMLKDLVQLALLKFPYLSLKKSLPIIIGSAHSCNISVILSFI